MKKKKANPISSNTRDLDYLPETGDDSGDDYRQVAKTIEVGKKQDRREYIAPMSMTKVASLARQRRVLAPKVSVSNTIKENHSKATLSMGELISSKKGTRQMEAFNQNLLKPICTKSGSKKSLVLVDEDGDEEDDDDEDVNIIQDVNEVDMELAGLEDDGNEGYIVRSQDYVDQDEEYEDMDLITSANKDDELQGDDSHDDLEGDDSHDDLEDSDTELAQDKLHFPESEKAIEISNTKKRGPTMLHLVHTRRVDEREIIICNEFGQPVGPVTKEKDVVGKFSRFLGTIARNNNYAPLIHTSWKKVPNKDKIWEYVLKKYDVPNAAKTWVLKTIGHAYKVEEPTKKIPAADFTQLLRMWNNKDVANRSLRAKENRMSQKNMHTAGPKSFARIREEMRNEDPNKELPDLCKMFERTRKRTEGRAYLDTYDDTASKILSSF
ncbi:hypothetical protein SSX86_006323 [Deinandra increscens subsp. villosa]|uniref:Uncharacterized protein n=1 Tax=Deinandra increscens subsp. villosa TaxID=3103831 RepID=A0AAP0DF18_9ASTR